MRDAGCGIQKPPFAARARGFTGNRCPPARAASYGGGMETMTSERPADHGRIMLGVVIMAAGVLLLIERLNLAAVHLGWRLWPLFPLGLGLLRVIDPPLRRDGQQCSRRSGAWLVLIGVWGLVNEFHVRGLDYGNSWPLIVIFAGIMIVWRSFEAPPGRPRDERHPF